MNRTSVKGWRSQAPDWINGRVDFTTHGALRGQSGSGWETGQLPSEWATAYRLNRERITYTVWSYATPIAWHVESVGWVIPDVRYSPTTSQHQGVVRRSRVAPVVS